MRHVFLLQAYGDNVISLSILNRLESSSYRIYGTKLTLEISKLLNLEKDINIVFDEIPAFYDIRARGICAAVRDLAVLYRFVMRNIPAGDRIVFEKGDVRFWLFRLIFWRYKLEAPRKRGNAYTDRALGFCQQEFAKEPDKKVNVGSYPLDIVINPLGRSHKKHLSKECMDRVLSACESHGLRVHLVDYLGLYSSYRKAVCSYHTNTTLKEALELLQTHPLYCGVDSLFIHLAFYFNKRFFCIMNYDSSYFMPPLASESDRFIFAAHSEREYEELSSNFSRWLISTQSEHP